MQSISNSKSIGNNFIYSLLVTTIAGLVNVIYPISIGLAFGPELMGNFYVLFNWITFLSIPIVNGIAPAIARFISANKKEESGEYKYIGIRVTIFYAFIVSILFPIFSFTIFNISIADFFVALITIFLFMIHYLIRYILQGQERFKQLFVMEIISFGVFIPMVLLFSILPYILQWTNLSQYFFLFFPIIVFHLTIDIIYLFPRIIRNKFNNIFNFPPVTKNILFYAFLIGLGSLLGLGTNQIQIIISDLYVNEFEVGVLSFWNSAVMPINLLSVSLGALLVPRITNLRKEDNSLAIDLVNKFNWSLSLFLIPLTGIIFLIIGSFPNILEVLTLNKYQMEIYWPIVILLGFQVINSLLANPSISFFASSEKNVRFNPIVSLIYSISVIISWIILVPIFKVIGFAIGLAIGGGISNIAVQIIAIFITKKKMGFHFIINIILFSIIGLFIYLLDVWNVVGILITCSIISLPVIIYGFYLIIKTVKNSKFSQQINTNLEEK